MPQPAGTGPSAARQPESPPQNSERASTRGWLSLLRESSVVVVTALVLSVLVKTFLIQAFFIPSGSMEPVLHGCPGCLNDRVLVNKLFSHTGGIHRGDIVVFRDSSGWLPTARPAPRLGSRVHDGLEFIGLVPSSAESDLIKRVIGVGGDTVEGRDGKVYVNGNLLDEPYVFPGNSPSESNFTVVVPAGKLWMMGDHRGASGDSRAHQQDPGRGFVPASDVVGRAFAIVWPVGRAAVLQRPATFDRPALVGAVSATVALVDQPFSLYTHCGINELTFGGRWYERVGGVLDDGNGNPPQGWDNPSQPGTLATTGSTAVFRDSVGHREVFQLRPGATRPKMMCS